MDCHPPVIGWLALIKGALILILPDVLLGMWRSLMTGEKMMRIWGAFALAFGLIIAWFSYCGQCGQTV